MKISSCILHINLANIRFDVCFNFKGTLGTLKVTGYLRGTPLSVNNLVHIPGLGDFQMSQIDAPYDPLAPNKRK